MTDLIADCSRCADLCCVAFQFDKSDSFAIDKPTLTPCPNLGAAGGCSIHDRRVEQGFSGCIPYTCHGAGQYVSEIMFAGRHWRDEPELTGPMARALLNLARLQELRAMLEAAAPLPLPDAIHAQRMVFLRGLLPPPDGWDLTTLSDAANGTLPGQIRIFLRDLRSHLPDSYRR